MRRALPTLTASLLATAHIWALWHYGAAQPSVRYVLFLLVLPLVAVTIVALPAEYLLRPRKH